MCVGGGGQRSSGARRRAGGERVEIKRPRPGWASGGGSSARMGDTVTATSSRRVEAGGTAPRPHHSGRPQNGRPPAQLLPAPRSLCPNFLTTRRGAMRGAGPRRPERTPRATGRAAGAAPRRASLGGEVARCLRRGRGAGEGKKEGGSERGPRVQSGCLGLHPHSSFFIFLRPVRLHPPPPPHPPMVLGMGSASPRGGSAAAPPALEAAIRRLEAVADRLEGRAPNVATAPPLPASSGAPSGASPLADWDARVAPAVAVLVEAASGMDKEVSRGGGRDEREGSGCKRPKRKTRARAPPRSTSPSLLSIPLPRSGPSPTRRPPHLRPGGTSWPPS